MAADDLSFPLPKPELGEHVRADDGMLLDLFELLRRQLSGFEQDLVADADLADVVQRPGKIQDVQLLRGAVQLPTQRERDLGHPAGMLPGVKVPGL